jgi:hypothetical protein
MKSKQVFYGMIGLVVIMFGLVVATVVFGDSFLRKQSDRLVELKLENEVIETQATSLLQAKKDIEKYSELESIANQIVPQDKDQARATREIVSIAEQAGVKIASIAFPDSTLGQAPKKDPKATTSTTTTPPTTTTTETQVKKVDGIPNLYQLEITVTSDTSSPTSYSRLIDFLSRLEQNRRTAQVSTISIQPLATNRSLLNFTLTVTVYIKP